MLCDDPELLVFELSDPKFSDEVPEDLLNPPFLSFAKTKEGIIVTIMLNVIIMIKLITNINFKYIIFALLHN